MDILREVAPVERNSVRPQKRRAERPMVLDCDIVSIGKAQIRRQEGIGHEVFRVTPAVPARQPALLGKVLVNSNVIVVTRAQFH